MKNHFSAAVAVLVVAVAAPLASAQLAAPAAPPAETSGGNATVLFLRPSSFGGSINSSLFDITDGKLTLVGVLSAGKEIAYRTTTGKHRFMVVGETADFMDAELSPSRTYYVRVNPRMGTLKARFTLRPVPANAPDLEADLHDCKRVEVSASSQLWAKDNQTDLKGKMAEFLPLWMSKPESERSVLAADLGR